MTIDIIIVVLFFLLSLSIVIASIMGTVYLTELAFSDEKNGVYCIKLSKFKINLARIAVILIWLSFFTTFSINIIYPKYIKNYY